MWYRSILKVCKEIIQFTLLVVFLKFFGLDALTRYQEKKTMIVKSKLETEGIDGPTITVLAKHNQSKTGWRQEPDKSGAVSDIVYDQCKDFEDFKTIEDCIKQRTFDWKTTVKDVFVGVDEFKVSMLDESLWTEDFTVGSDGRYYTVTIPTKIATEWRQHQIFLDLHPGLIYDIYIHDTNYFILNKHPFGLPLCHKEIALDPLRGKFYELILTKHEVLDLPSEPCEADKSYNFQVAAKLLAIVCYLCSGLYQGPPDQSGGL